MVSESSSRWRERAHVWATRLEERRDKEWERLQKLRRYRPVDFVFIAGEHDRASAGALLAGALAFRLFLWLLPLALIVVGSLGFVPSEDAAAGALTAGMGDVTATGLERVSSQAHDGRWFLLVFGLGLLYFASSTLARTIWVATTLAWQIPLKRLERKGLAVAFVIAAFVAMWAAVLTANWVRDRFPDYGTAATLSLLVVFVLIGWVALGRLPHPEGLSRWTLLPGAITFGLGVQIVHLITVYYLVGRLSSELYGALGGAATILFWGYLMARVLVGASTINRTWHSRPLFGTPATSEGGLVGSE